jgi:predicted nucleic acid-binding protein
MRVVVPDASVLLKWVLPGKDEEETDQALRIRDAATRGELLLKAPSLWLYEVGNTLSRKFPRQCNNLLQTFLAFQLDEPTWNTALLEKCLFLTEQYKVTFYDAAYHGLALAEGGTFVTADRDYVKRTHSAGAVIALADWR